MDHEYSRRMLEQLAAQRATLARLACADPATADAQALALIGALLGYRVAVLLRTGDDGRLALQASAGLAPATLRHWHDGSQATAALWHSLDAPTAFQPRTAPPETLALLRRLGLGEYVLATPLASAAPPADPALLIAAQPPHEHDLRADLYALELIAGLLDQARTISHPQRQTAQERMLTERAISIGGVASNHSDADPYQAIVEQLATVVCQLDADGRWMLLNPAWTTLTGFAVVETIGTPLLDYVHPDDRPSMHELLSALLARRDDVGRLICRYRCKTGGVCWLEADLRAVSVPAAGTVIVGTLVDATERKQAEARLRMAHDDLEQRFAARTSELATTNTLLQQHIAALTRIEARLSTSEAELRALLAALPDVILVLDADGRCLKIAPTNPALLYRPPAEQFGKTLHEVFPAPLADRFLASIRQTLASGQPGVIEYSLSIGGSEVWFATTIAPMRADAVVWVARDISEHKRDSSALEQRVADRTAALERVNQSLQREIAERRRAERALRDNEHWLRLMMAQVPAVFWTTDRELRVTATRGAGLAELGLQIDASVGMTIGEFFQTDDPSFPSIAAARTALSGQTATYDLEWGGRVFRARVDPFLDGAGAIAGTIGVSQDITEQRRAELFQAGQRRFFERLATGAALPQVLDELVRTLEPQLEEGGCAIQLLDDSGQRLRTIAGSRQALAFLRAVGPVPVGPRNGACGTAAFRGELVISADITTDPLWSGHVELALAYGIRACWSLPFRDHQGAVLGTFAVYYDAPRAPTEAEIAHLTTAAHLTAVAVERTRIEAALREGEELYRLITEHTTDLITVAEPDGRYLYVSPSCRALLGYDPEALIGLNPLDLLHPDDVAALRANPMPRVAHATDQILVRQRHADGSWRYLDIHGTVVLRGGRLQVVAVARDVTARRQAEIERQRLEDQLFQAQKMELLGSLAGGIAHDFNNILAAIGGNVQLALRHGSPQSPEYPLLEEIHKATTRAANLTRQLLTFSRTQQYERRAVDLNAMVGDLLPLLRRLSGPTTQLLVELPPDLPPLLADPVQIEQVVLNLVLNARDAMLDGGQLLIATGARQLDASLLADAPWARPGLYVQLSVRDSGSGIDSETRQRIFEPFFTTKDPGKGTGLGLAVVHGIVKQHGGLIQVASEPGAGSTFAIALPALQSERRADAAPVIPPIIGGHETILVVEDELSLRQLAATVLERLGYTVLCAADGVAAVDLFADRSAVIDLVLLDLHMPGRDGYAALAEMRRIRPDVPAIFVTGYADEQIRAAARALVPPVPILSKPYALDLLSRTVRELLDALAGPP